VNNRPPPTFLEIVMELGDGRFKDLAGEITLEVAKAVATTGTKGRVTFSIDIEMKEGKLHFDADFKTRKPYPPLPTSSWWVGEDNQLSLFDPDPDGPRVVTFPSPSPRGGGTKGQPH
jgi:hypothetical protein